MFEGTLPTKGESLEGILPKKGASFEGTLAAVLDVGDGASFQTCCDGGEGGSLEDSCGSWSMAKSHASSGVLKVLGDGDPAWIFPCLRGDSALASTSVPCLSVDSAVAPLASLDALSNALSTPFFSFSSFLGKIGRFLSDFFKEVSRLAMADLGLLGLLGLSSTSSDRNAGGSVTGGSSTPSNGGDKSTLAEGPWDLTGVIAISLVKDKLK